MDKNGTPIFVGLFQPTRNPFKFLAIGTIQALFKPGAHRKWEVENILSQKSFCRYIRSRSRWYIQNPKPQGRAGVFTYMSYLTIPHRLILWAIFHKPHSQTTIYIFMDPFRTGARFGVLFIFTLFQVPIDRTLTGKFMVFHLPIPDAPYVWFVWIYLHFTIKKITQMYKVGPY